MFYFTCNESKILLEISSDKKWMRKNKNFFTIFSFFLDVPIYIYIYSIYNITYTIVYIYIYKYIFLHMTNIWPVWCLNPHLNLWSKRISFTSALFIILCGWWQSNKLPEICLQRSYLSLPFKLQQTPNIWSSVSSFGVLFMQCDWEETTC